VLFELGQKETVECSALRSELELDAGYLSRILTQFRQAKLISTEVSKADARRLTARLTARGRRALDDLSARASERVRSSLAGLNGDDQRRLVAAMQSIQQILHGSPRSRSFVLRPLGPGDLGWVVQQHGLLYAQEYGWDETFEALVAQVASDYGAGHDPRRESAWIAEVEGEPAGSVFCVMKDEKVAQLRLMLTLPWARGMGIGTRLVEECVRFARRAGYEKMVLWTTHPLKEARRLYERAGFELVEEEKHRRFGHDLVEQRFSLNLDEGEPAAAPRLVAK
jgi:DNA-binding MarR family transcriptional regulator/GNAT superfamily N-acetyltransferase